MNCFDDALTVGRTGSPDGFLVAINTGSCPSAPGIAVRVRPSGNELRHHRHRDAELVLFGHCLHDQGWTARSFAAALDSGEMGAVTRWRGSYTALMRAGRDVVAYADLAGQFPLYFGERTGKILIGPDPALLATALQAAPDPLVAAIRIACPDVLPLYAGRSPFTRVSRLEAGQVLRVSAGSPQVSIRENTIPATARPTLPEAAEALRDALVEGIRLRSEGADVSADFSGGLDSTSVAFLALRYARSPLPAIFYHQPLAPAGDLTDAVRCSGLRDGLELIMVPGGEPTLPYASLADSFRDGAPLHRAVPGRSEPSLGVLDWRAPAVRLHRAAAAGSALHLTGEGADALVTAAPSYLASLVKPGSFLLMLQHCAAHAARRDSSPAGLVTRSVRLARTSARTALAMVGAELDHPRDREPGWGDSVAWWPSCGAAATWLTRAIRRQIAQIASDPATAESVGPDTGPADLAAQVQLRNSASAQSQVRALGRNYGLAVHAPFLDNAVISAALSLPAASRADPWSYKPLLRRAMADLVPPEVLARQTKGDYTAEDYAGIRRAMPALAELMRDSRLAALGIIEPAAVLETMQRMSAGLRVSLGPLNMLLATELWLRAVEERETCPA